ncbi:VOC family protein [Hellea balneolensis]|uniref:VOC family protein n=1 Tax=Hellea balneolensis TaxID=287478 RepID=UPI0004097F20|nr:VOC family protein [Hellea balneolensis]
MGLAIQKTKTNDTRPDISIGHIGLRVSDFQKSYDFFMLIGARSVMHRPGIAILELRGGTHLILRYDPDAAATHAEFDLMVDDIDEMRKRLIEAGYEPSKFSHGGAHRSFTVREPSGTLFEFTSSHVMGPV